MKSVVVVGRANGVMERQRAQGSWTTFCRIVRLHRGRVGRAAHNGWGTQSSSEKRNKNTFLQLIPLPAILRPQAAGGDRKWAGGVVDPAALVTENRGRSRKSGIESFRAVLHIKQSRAHLDFFPYHRETRSRPQKRGRAPGAK